MAYNHGVKVLENPTSLAAPITGTAALQVVTGVSPVNLAEDPYNATNVPKLAYSLAEAAAAVGYSADLKNYNLNQSISATFTKFAVAPIILINVLDPKKHKAALPETACDVNNMQAVLQSEGMLLDTITVKNGENTLQEGTDYIASFDSDGFVIITVLENGSAAEAKNLTISGDKIDPSKVTSKDIIGGYDVSAKKESGLELIRQVYPLFGMTPGLDRKSVV